MNDQEIRKILIAYLNTLYGDIRIYNEKSIGDGVCDVMAATKDYLMGFEIKSDCDNLSRLKNQVNAYSNFFDANYLVVSSSHLSVASDYIPDYWGILQIKEDRINLIRKAHKNKYVSRKTQLSILWQLELKNILQTNNLPLYTFRSKSFMIDRIVEKVDFDTLGRQIAYELFERDYSVWEEKVNEDKEYENKSKYLELLDTLSEEGEEITLDKWIDIYKKAVKVRDIKIQYDKENRLERTPHAIPFDCIEVSLGAPWISKDIISEFMLHLYHMNTKKEHKYQKKNNSRGLVYTYPEYEPVTGYWSVKDKDYTVNDNIRSEFGIEDYNAWHILEAILNLREINFKDDEKRTLAVLEKKAKIEDEFKNWIFLSEDRIWEVEEEYNKMFPKGEIVHYSGKELKFPEMSDDIKLYDYQKDAVQKIISTKNTLLAFDVGAGKTYIMIAAAMKMRQMGISRKNMFVVPNSIVGQWEKIFSEMYPKAKILSINPGNFKPNMRKKAYEKMKNGDFDGIIIAYSCFEMIPLSKTIIDNIVQEKLKKLNFYATGLERALSSERTFIINSMKDLLDSFDEESVVSEDTFDKLEINTIFLDEGHNYKNVPIRTKLRNIRGVNTQGSTKCLDMLQKIHYIQSKNNGRGAVLATGTPLCNSISDAYAMQLYLQEKELRDKNLHIFDNWVKTFAKPEDVFEIDLNINKYRHVRRFSKFFNLPELSSFFSQVAIFHTINEKDLPESNYSDCTISKSDELKDYMNLLVRRTEDIREKKVDKKVDNMLKISTDGRKAALDMRLVGKEQTYDDKSKVYNCIQNVYKIYRENPGCSQIIFCDYSTPKGEKFNIYDDLKEKLIDIGIPKKEIAFIHSCKSEEARFELFEKVNAGKIRVLIGSTFKLGIGANVQTKLKAIHHLDVPWRPADMVQREGRIIRRGNENDEINIFRYVVKGSFDAYFWQILQTKQNFISQFLKGTLTQRSASDLDENVLTYSQVKEIALEQPLLRELAAIENKISELKILQLRQDEIKLDAKEKLKIIPNTISKKEEELARSKNLLDSIKVYSKKELLNAFEKLKTMNILQLIDTCEEKTNIENILNFKIYILPKDGKKKYLMLENDDVEYKIKLGDSDGGIALCIANFLCKFEDEISYREKEIVDLRNQLKSYEKVLNEKNEYKPKIKEMEKKYREIKDELDKNNMVV